MKRPNFLSKGRKVNLLNGIAISTVIILSGCGYFGDLSPKNDGNFVNTAPTGAPEDSNKAYSETMNNMSGAKGLSNQAYLTQEVQDSIYRLAKLHQSVSDIQNRMNVVAPTVEQLEMMKTEINTLGKKFDQMQMTLRQDAPEGAMPTASGNPEILGQPAWPQSSGARPMNILHADPAMNAPVTTTATTAAASSYAPAPQSFASQIPAGATGLVDVRIGEHSGKTRIVLDLAKAVDIRYDLDNGENILVVELPGAAAGNISSKSFPKSPVLKGYDVQENAESTLVIFMFKKPTSIVETMQLKGTGKSATRYVFDMAK